MKAVSRIPPWDLQKIAEDLGFTWVPEKERPSKFQLRVGSENPYHSGRQACPHGIAELFRRIYDRDPYARLECSALGNFRSQEDFEMRIEEIRNPRCKLIYIHSGFNSCFEICETVCKRKSKLLCCG